MKFFNYLFFFYCSVNLFPSLFTVQASTVEITEVKEMAGGLYSISRRLSIYEGDLHYNENKGISGIHGSTLVYPKAPLIHPYDPQNGARINDGVANVPLQIHFPTSIRNALPDSIRRELELNHVTNDCLKILAVGQNFPWERGTVVCFRPQYATEPSGTEWSYNKTRQLRLGLFNSEENRVFFTGHQPNELINIGLSAHPTSNADQRTILSGNQPEIQGLAPDRGTSFWSYVGYRDDQDLNKYKAIVTLHWLLSDRQETALSEIIRRLPAKPRETDLENLVPTLSTNPDLLNGGEHLQKLLPIWNALERVEKEARKKKLQLVEQREKVAAAQKAKAEVAQREKVAAAQKAKAEAAQKAKAEAAQKAKAEAAQKAKAEAAQKAKAAAAQKAKAAAAQKAKAEAAQKAKAAAAQKAKAVAAQKAKAVAAQKAKAVAAQKARAVAAQKAKAVAAQKAKAVAVQKARAVAAQKAKVVAAQKARAVAAQKARAVAAQKARAVTAQKARAVTAQKARAVTAQRKKAEAARQVRNEHNKSRESAANKK